MVEVLVTSILDEFYHTVMKIFKMKELLVLAVCGVAFLLGIPCVMQVKALLSCMNFDPNINCKQEFRVHMSIQRACVFLGGNLCFPADGPLYCYRVHYVSCVL